MASVEAFISELPKCELHVHLEGTLEADLKFRMAERNHLDFGYKSVEEVRAAYVFNDIPSFMAIYYDGMKVLLTEQDFYDLTYAYLEKARSQNVLYAEMFFDPQAHTARGITFETVIGGIRRAQVVAESRLGIRSQLIMCVLRDWSVEYAMATVLESLLYKEFIVGLGVNSGVQNDLPIKFSTVFQRGRQEGYMLTMHCDTDVPRATEHIRQAIYDIGVDRIDHGANLVDEDDLIAAVHKRRLGVTVCPISNFYMTGDTKSAQIGQMLDLGLRVSVNSDDPSYFATYMNENLVRVSEETGMGEREIRQLMRNAFDAAWLPPADKAGYLATLDGYRP